ncbi:MAG TPA: chemotaxis protein CheW [Clostridia bacterium]|nr:chemotaxis protein CheW [Clostridia bacterium]
MADQKISEAKKYLIFNLGNEEYGIDIHKITTIIEKDMNIARVPKLPVFIRGVINLRGEIIPVISLRLKFGMDEDVYNTDTRIVIIKLDEISAGLIVDSVAEVIELDEESTESIANISGELSMDFITGVGKSNGRIITLLNLEKLVSLEDSQGK